MPHRSLSATVRYSTSGPRYPRVRRRKYWNGGGVGPWRSCHRSALSSLRAANAPSNFLLPRRLSNRKSNRLFREQHKKWWVKQRLAPSKPDSAGPRTVDTGMIPIRVAGADVSFRYPFFQIHIIIVKHTYSFWPAVLATNKRSRYAGITIHYTRMNG